MAAGAKQLLDEIVVGEVSHSHASVVVNRITAEGLAPHVLVGAATGVNLLVVGSRGRGGLAGMLLGSVSEQCAGAS